jgi:hypothetical protein
MLADAVAEFNRYNVHHVTIEDPQVAAIRIRGTRATDYQAFVRLLHDDYSVDVRDTDEGITLSKESTHPSSNPHMRDFGYPLVSVCNGAIEKLHSRRGSARCSEGS